MNAMASLNTPLPTRRILGLDVARALAVFGMVWVNFKVLIHGIAETPVWANLFDGRAAALFVVLAGVGVSQLARVRPTKRARGLLFRRALFLLVFGLGWSPIWFADILHFYAVYLSVAALSLTLSSRALWGLAASSVVVSTAMQLGLDYTVGWDLHTLSYTDFWTAQGMVRHLFFNGFHPVFPWIAFIFAGLAVGRLDLRDREVSGRLIRWGLGVWAVTEVVSMGLVAATTPELGLEVAVYLFGTPPLAPTAFYVLAGGGLSIAVLAAAVRIVDQMPENTFWVDVLAHTGQLAFSLYVLHVVVGLGLAWALEGSPLWVVVATVVPFWLGVPFLAQAWRRRYGRGPVEALMRKVTG